MKLIILAAGKGTRFLPLTENMPKGLIPLAGKTLIDHVLEPYLDSVSGIVLVVNEKTGHVMREHFGNSVDGHQVSYVIQDASMPQGTLGALLACRSLIGKGETFCVSNCDDLLLKEDVSKAILEGKPGIGITKSVMPWNYLGIDTKEGLIAGFRRHEKGDESFVTDDFFNGFCILTSDVLDFDVASTRDGELGLPQTLFANLDHYPLRAYAFSKWQAVNGPDNMKAAEEFLK